MKSIFKGQFFFYSLLISIFFLNACKKPGQTEKEVLPVSPTELTISLVSNTQSTLNWIDKSTNEAGFKVERKTGNGIFGVIATTQADITTINDAGLTPNTTYTYRVYSFNNTGKSLSYTNEVTITTYIPPTVTTSAISDTTGVSAISGGNITSDGGSPITARGIVWSSNPAPTVALATKTTDGSGVGQFTSKLEGLTKSTKYYVRAYATNAAGTAYGTELAFTTSTVDVNDGLLLYFPFNGNANDESGNNNNGTVNGGNYINDRSEKVNSAYSFFQGTNLVCTSKSIQSPNNFSYSFWVKTTSLIGGIAMSFNNGQCQHGGNWDRALFIENNKITFYTFPGAQVFNSVNTNVIDGKWHHMAVTMNSLGSVLYIDGIQIGVNTFQTTGQNSLGFFRIGGLSPNNVNNSLIGEYDEVRIYNRALSPQEVKYLSTK